MPTAKNFLAEDARQEIEASIRAAEAHTSAEIVCAVATESGRYDRAEAIIGLFTGLFFLLLLHLAAPWIGEQVTQPGDWNTPRFTFAFAEQAIAIIAGFLLGNILASYWHGLRRCFIRASQLDAEAARAAAFVFAERRLASTRHAGGLLIYVSLFEHRVVVLADAGVMQKLGQTFLNHLRDATLAGLKSHEPRKTFTDAIAKAGEELAAALPAAPDDVNELPDALVLIHPRP